MKYSDVVAKISFFIVGSNFKWNTDLNLYNHDFKVFSAQAGICVGFASVLTITRSAWGS